MDIVGEKYNTWSHKCLCCFTVLFIFKQANKSAMEKRYMPSSGDYLPAQDYSMPEDEKQTATQSFGEPAEMFVKPHKTLPHLKGRRVYQTGENVAAGEPSPVPGTSPVAGQSPVPGSAAGRSEELKKSPVPPAGGSLL